MKPCLREKTTGGQEEKDKPSSTSVKEPEEAGLTVMGGCDTHREGENLSYLSEVNGFKNIPGASNKAQCHQG